MSLIWPDYIIITIIVISTIISLFRGFIRESLSLAGWILAFWISMIFISQMSLLIKPYLNLPPSILSVVSFIILFVLTLMTTVLVINVISSLVNKTGLSGTDRSIGILFGLARGGVIVAVLILLAEFTQIPQDPWWQKSFLIPHFQQLTVAIKAFLPLDIAGKLHY